MKTRSLITSLILLASLSAGAAQADTAWMCRLNQDDTVLNCVADQDLTMPVSDAPAAPAPLQVVINGTGFPLNPQMIYAVPLLAPAYDMELVRQLADATMCYRQQNCTVTLVEGAPTQIARR